MNQRIVWQAPDGSLRLTVPLEPPLPGESAAHYLDRIALAAQATDPGLADCTRVATVSADALPASRRFRIVWHCPAGTVRVHLPSARLLLLAEVRAERNRRLVESDADRARLEEVGTPEQRQDLTAYRQQLRDLPSVVAGALDGLATAAALKAYQPPWPALPEG